MTVSWTRCESFATALEDLPPAESDDDDPAVMNAEILRLVREHGLTLSDFIELDERPGQFTVAKAYTFPRWHRRLRRARNDRTCPLFDTLLPG